MALILIAKIVYITGKVDHLTQVASGLITIERLAQIINQPESVPKIRIVDARWRGDGTSSRELFQQGHIPGAVHLDWQFDFSLTDAQGLRHMLLPPDRFAGVMEKAGIDNTTLVVAYADSDYSGAARLWWALRYYGHENVVVVDGGWNRWRAQNLPVSANQVAPTGLTTSSGFMARPQPYLLATQSEIKAALVAPTKPTRLKLVDTRPPEQYRGQAVWTPTGSRFLEQEASSIEIGARRPMKAGHIPGAVNLHSTPTFLDQNDWVYLPPEQIRAKANAVDLQTDDRIITYCGVGISASLGLFGLYLAGFSDLALYEASWEEWGTDPTCPVETGDYPVSF